MTLVLLHRLNPDWIIALYFVHNSCNNYQPCNISSQKIWSITVKAELEMLVQMFRSGPINDHSISSKLCHECVKNVKVFKCRTELGVICVLDFCGFCSVALSKVLNLIVLIFVPKQPSDYISVCDQQSCGQLVRWYLPGKWIVKDFLIKICLTLCNEQLWFLVAWQKNARMTAEIKFSLNNADKCSALVLGTTTRLTEWSCAYIWRGCKTHKKTPVRGLPISIYLLSSLSFSGFQITLLQWGFMWCR